MGSLDCQGTNRTKVSVSFLRKRWGTLMRLIDGAWMADQISTFWRGQIFQTFLICRTYASICDSGFVRTVLTGTRDHFLPST
jgi:hypothetical protein